MTLIYRDEIEPKWPTDLTLLRRVCERAGAYAHTVEQFEGILYGLWIAAGGNAIAFRKVIYIARPLIWECIQQNTSSVNLALSLAITTGWVYYIGPIVGKVIEEQCTMNSSVQEP